MVDFKNLKKIARVRHIENGIHPRWRQNKCQAVWEPKQKG